MSQLKSLLTPGAIAAFCILVWCLVLWLNQLLYTALICLTAAYIGTLAAKATIATVSASRPMTRLSLYWLLFRRRACNDAQPV